MSHSRCTVFLPAARWLKSWWNSVRNWLSELKRGLFWYHEAFTPELYQSIEKWKWILWSQMEASLGKGSYTGNTVSVIHYIGVAIIPLRCDSYNLWLGNTFGGGLKDQLMCLMIFYGGCGNQGWVDCGWVNLLTWPGHYSWSSSVSVRMSYSVVNRHSDRCAEQIFYWHIKVHQQWLFWRAGYGQISSLDQHSEKQGQCTREKLEDHSRQPAQAQYFTKAYINVDLIRR